MTYSTAGVTMGAPERIAAIQNRFQSLRGASSRPTSSVDFEALLAAENARSALDIITDTAPASSATDALTTSLLPALLDPPTEPTVDDAPAVENSAAGEAVIDAAEEYLGVPYLWGGTDPVKGFDCSGLIQAAYRDIGVEMPKWSRHQATMGVEVASIDDALPGDVLAFGKPVNHVGLYVGDGKMLHAPRTGDVVKIADIDRPIATIRRIVTAGATVAPGETLKAVAGDTVGTVPPPADSPPVAPATPAPAGPTVVDEVDPVDWAKSDAERRYLPFFQQAGAAWNVDPALLAAMAKTESGFNPSAVSPAGAQGLMQFMPATASSMNVDPWDPSSAIDGAARYMRTSLDRFGSTELAIASYNAGPGAVARYGDIPPYRETQNYVRKVLAAWKERS